MSFLTVLPVANADGSPGDLLALQGHQVTVVASAAAALKAVQLGYVLLPKMPGRDPITGVTHEQTVAELQAELAIANEHLKALLKQNELLKEALNEKMRSHTPGAS